MVMEVLRSGEAAVTNSLASTRLTGMVSSTSPANTVRYKPGQLGRLALK